MGIPGTVLAAEGTPAVDTGDTAWVLISAALVMLMTPGLAFFYGGMVRSKNVLTTIMQSFFIVAMVSVQWVLFGFSLAFGPDINGVIGSLSWAGLTDMTLFAAPYEDYSATVPLFAFAAFQCMFAVITAALITGAYAERFKFGAFVLFTFLWTTFLYDPMAHWVWGVGGWLRDLGALDFAGGTVIHILSGGSGNLIVGWRRMACKRASHHAWRSKRLHCRACCHYPGGRLCNRCAGRFNRAYRRRAVLCGSGHC